MSYVLMSYEFEKKMAQVTYWLPFLNRSLAFSLKMICRSAQMASLSQLKLVFNLKMMLPGEQLASLSQLGREMERQRKIFACNPGDSQKKKKKRGKTIKQTKNCSKRS